MKVKVTNPSRLYTPYFDLNERIVYDWDASTLVDGPVASWADKIVGLTGTQGTSANQPTASASAGGAVFSGGTKNLVLPNIAEPTRYIRAALIIAKYDIANAASSDGTLMYINGDSGSTDNRAPLIGYTKAGTLITASYASTNLSVAGGDGTSWHAILFRVVNGVAKLSVDGNTEATAGTNAIIARNVTNQLGAIGDFRATTLNMTIARIVLFQDQMTDDEAQRVPAWALWSKGAQANLPGGHPYASAAPTTKRWGNPYPMISDAAFTSAMITSGWATNNTKFKQNYGNDITALYSGFTQDFLEDFTSLSAVTDETGASGGTATFFSPSIDDTGGSETPRMPSQSPSVFSQSGSELIITMQQVGGTGPWYSSSLCSVNLAGRGYTFNPAKAPFYIEYKVRMSLGNAKSLWTALWMKPVSEFRNCTTGHFEWDLCETYNSESAGNQHVTIHRWPAPRAFAGRNSLHQFSGKDFALDGAHAWPNGAVSLYDNTTHTISYFISKTLTGSSGGPGFLVAALDGLELGRWPLLADLLQPTYLIASFNQLPAEAAQASGTYTMAVDSIKVLKGLNY